LLQMWPAEFLEQFTIGFEWIRVWRLWKRIGQFCVSLGVIRLSRRWIELLRQLQLRCLV